MRKLSFDRERHGDEPHGDTLPSSDRMRRAFLQALGQPPQTLRRAARD